MFRKFIKRFKKKNLYLRIAIVYAIFLIIKWFMYEISGIEIGSSVEGMTGSNLVGKIHGHARELANLCTKKQSNVSVSSSSNNPFKLKLKTCQAEKLRLKQQIKNLQKKDNSKCPKCDDCSKYAAVLKKL